VDGDDVGDAEDGARVGTGLAGGLDDNGLELAAVEVGQQGVLRDASPEGEGRAGKPIWTVLQHSGVGDISAVVTRYFGGILLGKGGLVRAYSGGVKLALATLPQFEATVPSEDYGADVTLHLRLPHEQTQALQQRPVELTNGQVLIETLSQEALST
jgi:putative IMPACT (imprinted ancient) family translation regulator